MHMITTRAIALTWAIYAIIFSCLAIAEEPTYTKSTSLPPIRITYSELQSVLDKSAPLMLSANAAFATRAPTEKVRIKHGELQVEVVGHQLQGGNAKLPKIATELVYTASAYSLDTVPIATISLSFYDFDRKITVEGRSAEQVDAVFASLKSDFLALSSPFGGSLFRAYSGLFIFLLCLNVALVGVISWLATRRTTTVVPVAFAILSLVLLFTLPFEVILAGFSVSEFDPSLLNRYGAEISVILWVIGLPLSYLVPHWLEAKPSPAPVAAAVTPNKPMQGTRRKRRAPDR